VRGVDADLLPLVRSRKSATGSYGVVMLRFRNLKVRLDWPASARSCLAFALLAAPSVPKPAIF